MAASCARRILDAATICMALVIWAVFLTDLMRRRMSRVLGMRQFRLKGFLEFVDGIGDLGLELVAQLALGLDLA